LYGRRREPEGVRPEGPQRFIVSPEDAAELQVNDQHASLYRWQFAVDDIAAVMRNLKKYGIELDP
jgi:hypothetical protein